MTTNHPTDHPTDVPCDVDTFLHGVAAVCDGLTEAHATGTDLTDEAVRQELAVKLTGAALAAFRAAGATVDLGAHCHD